MNIRTNKSAESKSKTPNNSTSLKRTGNTSTFQFADKRLQTIEQKDLHKMANNSLPIQQMESFRAMANSGVSIQKQGFQEEEELQMKRETVAEKASAERSPQINRTGLPDNLKSGIENLSGISLDDVKVHRNSDKPAQLQAHAYAQGTEIHLGPGQEKHLPHEAWHVVQQKQGRVKPTMQMKGAVNVNNDAGLEKEADVMGAKALQANAINHNLKNNESITGGNIIQRVVEDEERPMIDATLDRCYPLLQEVLDEMIRFGNERSTKKDQNQEYAEEKGEQAIDAIEEGITPEGLMKKGIAEIWGNMSAEEKTGLIAEVAGQLAKGTIASLGKMGVPNINGGSSSNSSSSRSGGNSESGGESALSVLSEITLDDIRTLYKAIKTKRKVEKDISDAKEKVKQKGLSVVGNIARWGTAKVENIKGNSWSKLYETNEKKIDNIRELLEIAEGEVKAKGGDEWYEKELNQLFKIAQGIFSPIDNMKMSDASTKTLLLLAVDARIELKFIKDRKPRELKAVAKEKLGMAKDYLKSAGKDMIKKGSELFK